MSQSPKRRKNSLRLANYDYSQSGGYYVTMCTHEKAKVLGQVVDGEVVLSDIGQVVRDCWLAIPEHFEHVGLGMYVIMPNHIHSVILIHDDILKTEDVEQLSSESVQRNPVSQQKSGSPSKSLSSVISSFKASVTREVRKQKSSDNIKLWQRGFYDHIIRNEDDHRRIIQYIHENPLKWKSDDYY